MEVLSKEDLLLLSLGEVGLSLFITGYWEPRMGDLADDRVAVFSPVFHW